MDAGEQDITEDVIMDVVRILLFSDSMISLTFGTREEKKKTGEVIRRRPRGEERENWGF